ncbi:hypothetical protein ACLOJK_001772 [Asimina triloba]
MSQQRLDMQEEEEEDEEGSGRWWWWEMVVSVWRVEGVPRERVQSTREDEEANGSRRSAGVSLVGVLLGRGAKRKEKELLPAGEPQEHGPSMLPWELQRCMRKYIRIYWGKWEFVSLKK